MPRTDLPHAEPVFDTFLTYLCSCHTQVALDMALLLEGFSEREEDEVIAARFVEVARHIITRVAQDDLDEAILRARKSP